MVFKNGNINDFINDAEEKILVCYGSAALLSKLAKRYSDYQFLDRVKFISGKDLAAGPAFELNGKRKPCVKMDWFLNMYPHEGKFILLFPEYTDLLDFLEFLSYGYQIPNDIIFYIGRCLTHNPVPYNFPVHNLQSSDTQIPRTIHYCWFGGNPKPAIFQKCMDSWKKYCPDYDIIEWNESNYDVTKHPYMAEAYRYKKWTFIADYARLDIIYRYGGVYLDTDVELLKPIDLFLYDTGFCGMEPEGLVNPGLGFGAVTEHPFIRIWRDMYDHVSFINDDNSFNLTISPGYQTEILLKYGFKIENTLQKIQGMTIYPADIFSPMHPTFLSECITENTHSVHHYAWTWGRKDELISRYSGARDFRDILQQFSKDKLYHFPLPDLPA